MCVLCSTLFGCLILLHIINHARMAFAILCATNLYLHGHDMNNGAGLLIMQTIMILVNLHFVSYECRCMSC